MSLVFNADTSTFRCEDCGRVVGILYGYGDGISTFRPDRETGLRAITSCCHGTGVSRKSDTPLGLSVVGTPILASADIDYIDVLRHIAFGI